MGRVRAATNRREPSFWSYGEAKPLKRHADEVPRIGSMFKKKRSYSISQPTHLYFVISTENLQQSLMHPYMDAVQFLLQQNGTFSSVGNQNLAVLDEVGSPIGASTL